MSDDTLNDEGSGDSLSETIAAALEEQQGEDVIHELANVSDDAPETPETDRQAVADGGGAETPGDGGAGQTEETEPSSAEVRQSPSREYRFAGRERAVSGPDCGA